MSVNYPAIEHYFNKCTVPRTIVLVANTPKLILDVNAQRMYAAIINGQAEAVTLTLTDITGITFGKGIPLFAFASYEINQHNLHRGKISAVCDRAAELVCFECTR